MGVSTRIGARGASLRIATSVLFILSAILSCAGPRLAFAQADPCPQGILGSDDTPFEGFLLGLVSFAPPCRVRRQPFPQSIQVRRFDRTKRKLRVERFLN